MGTKSLIGANGQGDVEVADEPADGEEDESDIYPRNRQAIEAERRDVKFVGWRIPNSPLSDAAPEAAIEDLVVSKREHDEWLARASRLLCEADDPLKWREIRSGVRMHPNRWFVHRE